MAWRAAPTLDPSPNYRLPQAANVPIDEILPTLAPVLTRAFIPSPPPNSQSADPAVGYATSG
jgi:hypothetical protein